MESREYDLTPKMTKTECHCVSAIQYQFKKIKDSEGEAPMEIIFFYIVSNIRLGKNCKSHYILTYEQT